MDKSADFKPKVRIVREVRAWFFFKNSMGQGNFGGKKSKCFYPINKCVVDKVFIFYYTICNSNLRSNNA
jgi:hypothetical protein